MFARFVRPLAALFVFATLASAPAAAQRLADRIDAALDQPGLTDGFWGVLVVDATTGQTLYSRNANRRFVPASNTKLYSGATVIDALGPDARFSTRLYASAPIGADGTLIGDVIFRGGGDPSLGSQPDEDVAVDKFAVLRDWAERLRAHGLARVTGNIVGDDDVFDDQALGTGWTWDDEIFYYSAQISGLSFGDNCLDIAIAPTAPGQAGRLTVPDAAEGFATFDNQTVTGPSGSGIREGYVRLPGTNRFVLTSRVAANARDRECVSVQNPTLYAAHALRWALQNAGIRVDGQAVDHDDVSDVPVDYAGQTLLLEHTSEPLRMLLRDMEKFSLNHYAEIFLKHVGRQPNGPAPTDDEPLGSTARGLEVMQQGLLRRAGINTERFGLVDGSGLSRMDAVTPSQTVALLRYMHAHPDVAVREAFRDALPVGGVDGTLKNRLANLRGRVHAKTGTLTGASALSGYLTTATGRTLVFSLMANQYSAYASQARRAQDSVLTLLYRQ
ncbi:MAG: D-alanyl-D-alanine carboxypeptidase/D-alanyl-D-alanine-endopeptidase [Bacteroidetes bacterium]|nr:D-alanyl-D-alanine carboxypeptidase/D-alanyl-D-alanine-endopeptidase [Bacteroidota bacterium]